MIKYLITFLIILFPSVTIFSSEKKLVWPTSPDTARIEYITQINFDALKLKTSVFGKLGRIFAGNSEEERISLPFDILSINNKLYLTCQNMPALIEINRDKKEYKLISDNKLPLQYPISLCEGKNGDIYFTDVEQKAVFKYSKNKLSILISSGLNRPTGISSLPDKNRLYIIDTGDHALKIFNLEGELIKTVTSDSSMIRFHYPTFVENYKDYIIVNDALNYKIKKFDSEGNFISEFGKEGDGPGTFSRPKGIAIDSDSHIYVVDNLVDNFQIFDELGNVLLVVGSSGQAKGQFWSPVGIDIKNDTLFIADMFNNRIQIFHYLGDI